LKALEFGHIPFLNKKVKWMITPLSKVSIIVATPNLDGLLEKEKF
jgi:hypothetical protein